MASGRACVCGEADVGGHTVNGMTATWCRGAVHTGWLP